jgi:hypothetical protein
MINPIQYEAQEPYVVVAPKWMAAPEYASEVERFKKETGFKVVFAEDFIPTGKPYDNQES